MRVASFVTAAAATTNTWAGNCCGAYAYLLTSSSLRTRANGNDYRNYSTISIKGSDWFSASQRGRYRPHRGLQRRPSWALLSSLPPLSSPVSSSSSSALFASKSNGSDRPNKAAKRTQNRKQRPEKDNGNDEEELTEEESIFLTTEASTVSSPFATTYHAPVMWKECIDGLLGCPREQQSTERRIFVDGTLGGGGHSEALLQQLKGGDVVIGCDVDPKALVTASKRLQKYMQNDPTLPTFVPVASNFAHLAQVLLTIPKDATAREIQDRDNNLLVPGLNCIEGILLDLGVSSHQIDTPERGFAFMKEGPLDMRMGATGRQDSSSLGMTAADLCNELDENELARILKQYGDEPRSRSIARSIVDHRPLSTTQDLVQAVSAVTPAFHKQSKRKGRTATLARVFQSLRIVVNQEDQVLQQVLEETCPSLLREGGRLVVLSYHSMEDRATKRVMRDGTTAKYRNSEQDIFGNYMGPPLPFKPVGKFQKASEQEVALNPRARSATLRVAERLAVLDDEEEESLL